MLWMRTLIWTHPMWISELTTGGRVKSLNRNLHISGRDLRGVNIPYIACMRFRYLVRTETFLYEKYTRTYLCSMVNSNSCPLNNDFYNALLDVWGAWGFGDTSIFRDKTFQVNSDLVLNLITTTHKNHRCSGCNELDSKLWTRHFEVCHFTGTQWMLWSKKSFKQADSL